jgi:hypothetical protein
LFAPLGVGAALTSMQKKTNHTSVATFCFASFAFLAHMSAAGASAWKDVTTQTIGSTEEWTNKVELADVNGDGLVDILFANGAAYNKRGTPEANRVFVNQGPNQPFKEVTNGIFGDAKGSTRALKVRDVSSDGIPDIFVSGNYESQSRLYLGLGNGAYREVTATHLPVKLASVGDFEFGDVDGDGDLDIVMADWGPGDPFKTQGAPVILWKNSGDGHFTDGSKNLPAVKVRWSWDIELFDVDNDYDLDVMVSCKVCDGGKLFLNSGTGTFIDASSHIPQFTNNYEFEPIDLDGDGFLDVVTINDGEQLADEFDRREHVFQNNGKGGFGNATSRFWPNAANVGADDNAAVVLDFDSDGDADFLIGSLSGADRLLMNDGTGKLSLDQSVFGGTDTPGTLGLAVADLNGDHRLDVVQSQGEVVSDERVYFGADIPVDSAPPIVDLVEQVASIKGQIKVRARIHDNKTPVMPHDFTEVVLVSGSQRIAMQWYGGAMWQASAHANVGDSYKICATDAAGNEECSAEKRATNGKADDAGAGSESAGCSTNGHGSSAAVLMIAVLGWVVGRRKSNTTAL